MEDVDDDDDDDDHYCSTCTDTYLGHFEEKPEPKAVCLFQYAFDDGLRTL